MKKYKSPRRLKVKPPKVIRHAKEYNRRINKLDSKKILKEVLEKYKEN
jgi:hypothetical protein